MERQVVNPFKSVNEEEAKTLLMIVERQKEAFKNTIKNEVLNTKTEDLVVVKKEWPKRDYTTQNNKNPFLGFCKKMFNIFKENVSVNVNFDDGETSNITINKDPGVMPDVESNISKGPVKISFDTKNMMKNIDHKGGGIRTY